MSNNTASSLYTSLITTIDPLLEKYAIGREIFAAYGDQHYNAAMLIKSLTNSQSVPVNQETYYHFEDLPINQNLLTAAGGPYIAASPGASVVVNLATSNNSTLNGLLPVREKWTIVDPNNNQRLYRIETVTNSAVTPSITIAPLDPTITISISGGVLLKIGPSAFGEGTSQPGGIVTPVLRRNFNLSILKEGLNFSGSEATNEASVDAVSLAGMYTAANIELPAGLGNTYVVRNAKQMEFRMMEQHADLYYWGEQNTNTSVVVDSGTDGTVRASAGLKRTTTLYGTPIPYSVGSMTMGIFSQAGDALDAQYVSPSRAILWLQGRKQYTEAESLLATNNYYTGIRYDRESSLPYVYGDAMAVQGKKYNFAFIGVELGGYKYVSMREPLFTDPNGTGALGYPVPNLGFMLPLASMTDPVNKVSRDTVTMRYKSLGGINRAYKTWFRGQEITNVDTYDINMQANVSYEWFGANRFIQVQGT